MFLYLAANTLMPGFCKIGIAKDVDIRLSNLYGSWILHKKWEITHAAEIETEIKQRLRPLAALGYELFNCPITFVEELAEILINEIEPAPDLLQSIFRLTTVNQVPSERTYIVQTSQEFGAIIRQVRKQARLTQSAVAAACGTGVRFIVELEAGKPTCELNKSLLIAKMLGIKIYLGTPKL